MAPYLRGHLVDRALSVHVDHPLPPLEVPCSLLVALGDLFLQLEGLEKLRFALPQPAPERHLRSHGEEESSVRRLHEAVQRTDPRRRRGHSLVGERGEDVAIADHVHPPLERWFDFSYVVIQSIRREQERERAPIPAPPAGRREPPAEDRAELHPHRTGRRLRRDQNLPTRRLQLLGEPARLRGRPGAIQPLENEKATSLLSRHRAEASRSAFKGRKKCRPTRALEAPSR